MLKQATRRESAFLILVALAVTIVGLGTFLDGNVFPNSTSFEDLIQETVAKSSLDSFESQTTTVDQSSEVARLLQRTIDVANQSDWHKTEALYDKQAASNEKVNQSNHLLHHS